MLPPGGAVPAGAAACHSGAMARTPKPAGPAPSAAELRQAALLHLARFAATERGLALVLQRRVDRWARRAREEGLEVEEARAAAHVAAAAVARSLSEGGLVDDASFAAARSARLARAGRSRRAIAAHLIAKGLAAEAVAEHLPRDELGSAVALTRRRRLGAFGAPAGERPTRDQELAILARAGFPRGVAEQALDLERAAAEALLRELRR